MNANVGNDKSVRKSKNDTETSRNGYYSIFLAAPTSGRAKQNRSDRLGLEIGARLRDDGALLCMCRGGRNVCAVHGQ